MSAKVQKMIDEEIKSFKRWHFDNLEKRVGVLQQEISCLRGYHTTIVNGDKTQCSRCGTVTGKVVAPDAKCTSPKN